MPMYFQIFLGSLSPGTGPGTGPGTRAGTSLLPSLPQLSQARLHGPALNIKGLQALEPA